MQNPDNQIVTDKVWHELAFGLESLGCDNAYHPSSGGRDGKSYFGIQSMVFTKMSAELSGGQKQLLKSGFGDGYAPVTLLILDEPTSQLDPDCSFRFFRDGSRKLIVISELL